MGELENVLGVVERLHAASTAPDGWTPALDAVRALIGGVGTTLELFDRKSLEHRFFAGMSLPGHETRIDDYFEHYHAFNVRARDALRQSPGAIRWDQQFISEAEMDRNPFYAEFLVTGGMRYHIGGMLHTGPDEFGVLAVQMSRTQTDRGTREAALLRMLLPHAGQAIDVALRLQAAPYRVSLAEAVDWLADGIVVVGRRGRVLSANAAAAAIGRRRDGFDIARGLVEFTDPGARRRLAAALREIAAGDADPSAGSGGDFIARRAGEAVPYTIAVRPLRDARAPGAVALLFVHDPLASNASAAMLQQAFGLTPAEAHLAAALRAGQPPDAYARLNGVSINTVYTHLAHIKDKCGRSRAGELIGVLNAVATSVAPIARPAE